MKILLPGRVYGGETRFSIDMTVSITKKYTNHHKRNHKSTHISVMYGYFSIFFLKIYSSAPICLVC